MSDYYPDTENWKRYWSKDGGSEFIGDVAFRDTVYFNHLTGCQIECWEDVSTFVKAYSANFLGQLDAEHFVNSFESLKPSGCTVVADLSCSPVETYPHMLRGLYDPSRNILWEGMIAGPDEPTFETNLNNSVLSSFGTWVVSSNLISVTGGPDDIRFMAFTDGVFTDTIKTHSDCASAGIIWERFEDLIRCIVTDTDDQIAKEVYVNPDNLCTTSAINVQSVIEDLDAGLCDVTTTVASWSAFWGSGTPDQSAFEVPYDSLQDALVSSSNVQDAVDVLEDKVFANCQQLSSALMTVSAGDGTFADLYQGEELIFVSPDNSIIFTITSGSVFVNASVNLASGANLLELTSDGLYVPVQSAGDIPYVPVCVDLSATNVEEVLNATETVVCDLQNTVSTFSADHWVTSISSNSDYITVDEVAENDFVLDFVKPSASKIPYEAGCFGTDPNVQAALSVVETVLCDLKTTVDTNSATCWESVVSSSDVRLVVSPIGDCNDYALSLNLPQVSASDIHIESDVFCFSSETSLEELIDDIGDYLCSVFTTVDALSSDTFQTEVSGDKHIHIEKTGVNDYIFSFIPVSADEVVYDDAGNCIFQGNNIHDAIATADAEICDLKTTVQTLSSDTWVTDISSVDPRIVVNKQAENDYILDLEVPFSGTCVTATDAIDAVPQIEQVLCDVQNTVQTLSSDTWVTDISSIDPRIVVNKVDFNDWEISLELPYEGANCIIANGVMLGEGLSSLELALCDVQTTVNTFSADCWKTGLSSLSPYITVTSVGCNDYHLNYVKAAASQVPYDGVGCITSATNIKDAIQDVESAVCDVTTTVKSNSAEWFDSESSVSPAIDITVDGVSSIFDFVVDPNPINQAEITPSGLYVAPTEFLGMAGIIASGFNGIDLSGTGAASDPLLLEVNCCDCVEDMVDVLYERVMVCTGEVSAGDVCIDLTKQFVDSFPLSVLKIYDQDMNIMWEGSIFANTPAELETQLNEQLFMFGPWTATSTLICVNTNPLSASDMLDICEDPPNDICFIELANEDGTKQDIIPIEIQNEVIVTAPTQGNLPLWTKFSELVFKAFVFGDELAKFTCNDELSSI